MVRRLTDEIRSSQCWSYWRHTKRKSSRNTAIHCFPDICTTAVCVTFLLWRFPKPARYVVSCSSERCTILNGSYYSHKTNGAPERVVDLCPGGEQRRQNVGHSLPFSHSNLFNLLGDSSPTAVYTSNLDTTTNSCTLVPCVPLPQPQALGIMHLLLWPTLFHSNARSYVPSITGDCVSCLHCTGLLTDRPLSSTRLFIYWIQRPLSGGKGNNSQQHYESRALASKAERTRCVRAHAHLHGSLLPCAENVKPSSREVPQI